ncbi:pyridoxal-phosphate dependent enzyme [Micromonospora sp. BRA006-A]|nr:pyridoxal-phosphate dependent enzyme [Micromonospora sp. BRA006-A]
MVIELADIQAAADRIADVVVHTPTVPSPGLTELLGVPVTAKLELLQRTGSFKARGAAAKLLALDDAERAAGVVAVSGGNHGIAVAVMAGALGGGGDGGDAPHGTRPRGRGGPCGRRGRPADRGHGRRVRADEPAAGRGRDAAAPVRRPDRAGRAGHRRAGTGRRRR